MPDGPPPDTLKAFGCQPPATPVPGGQGSTWRSGEIILKPMFDPEGAIWEAETLERLPKIGYRIATPIRTQTGEWVSQGWTASQFLPGFSPKGTHLKERFEAARTLHKDLETTDRPPHFDHATDPWAMADKIAFGFAEWTADPRITPCLERFRAQQIPIRGQWQVIHGDLAGNFLIQEGLPPAIIDFTPKWSPGSFGEAVMAIDICLWENVPFEQVTQLLTPNERQLLPLAAARRLLEIDTHHKMHRADESIFTQVDAYENLASEIESA